MIIFLSALVGTCPTDDTDDTDSLSAQSASSAWECSWHADLADDADLINRTHLK